VKRDVKPACVDRHAEACVPRGAATRLFYDGRARASELGETAMAAPPHRRLEHAATRPVDFVKESGQHREERGCGQSVFKFQWQDRKPFFVISAMLRFHATGSGPAFTVRSQKRLSE
jgi:hypothetical protein